MSTIITDRKGNGMSTTEWTPGNDAAGIEHFKVIGHCTIVRINWCDGPADYTTIDENGRVLIETTNYADAHAAALLD